MSIKKLQKEIEEEFETILLEGSVLNKSFLIKLLKEKLNKAYELGREKGRKEFINTLLKENPIIKEQFEEYKNKKSSKSYYVNKISETLSKKDNS